MQKCNFCITRWTEGKKPICVAACPMRALDAGKIDDLRDSYGKVQTAEGLSYRSKRMPSVIFKAKAPSVSPRGGMPPRWLKGIPKTA